MNNLLRTYVLPALVPLLAGIGACPSGGCAMLTPGASVQRGVGQSTLKEWRADGSFWAEAKGTHEEAYTMAQGHLVMKEGDDGMPVVDWEKSVVEYYLTARPSAQVAGTAMGQAFAASTAQMGMLNQTIDKILSLVPLMAPVAGNTNTEAGSAADGTD